MSGLNGDKARFRINRARKLQRRQRIQALVAGLKTTAEKAPAPARRRTRATTVAS